MIDLALLRDNPDLVKRSQEARGESPETVDAALAADRVRRAAITAFEELRAEQNAHGKLVAKAPKEDKPALVAQAKDLSDRVKAAQAAVTDAEDLAPTWGPTPRPACWPSRRGPRSLCSPPRA